MHELPTEPDMSMEDRLKAIAYQFILLHDRWAEERQAAAKQGADLTELLKLFSAQVKDFQVLASKVRQAIAHAIHESATAATQEMTETISQIATDKVDVSTKQLQQAVEAAIQQLNAHQKQKDGWHYWWIGSIFALALAVGLCAVRFVMPDPYLPLTGEQLQTYQHGQVFEAFWPKLSKKEKEHLIDLTKAKNTIQPSTDDSSNETDANINAY